MVTIVASYNITPNQPTPNDSLWLSDNDHIVFLGHVPTVYIYKLAKEDDTTERMRDSLSKILVDFYPIAGRLSLTKSGRMEVNCNAKGVTLLEAETTKTLGDYGDFSPHDESTRELVPKVDYTQPIEELPLLIVQLTRFHDHSDGGGSDEALAIGVAISHPLVDGLAAIHFINTWAKLARGEALEPNEMPFLDRTILKLCGRPMPSAPWVDLPELQKLSMADPTVSQPIAPCIDLQEARKSGILSGSIVVSPSRVALLKLTSNQVEELKKKANDQPSKKVLRPYSRFEAIAAHIWKCSSKTSHESSENQPTQLQVMVDIRNRLVPPLPQNYFGNAVKRSETPKCYVGEIISNPLSDVAQKIREAIDVVTNENIKSYFDVGFGQERLDFIRDFFVGQGLPKSTYSSLSGKHNFVITSWMTVHVYEADFGWGKPMHFGLATKRIEDRAMIIPTPDGDGVFVSINFLTADEMQLFKKLFYKYLSEST